LEISLYLITAYKNLTLLDYGLQKFNFTWLQLVTKIK
jgi:hypothetical protein